VKWFDYAAPRSLEEACELLAAHPRAQLLAGGTDLLVQLRSAQKETDFVIDVKGIPVLKELLLPAVENRRLKPDFVAEFPDRLLLQQMPPQDADLLLRRIVLPFFFHAFSPLS